MIKLKGNVRIKALCFVAVWILELLGELSELFKKNMWITSANDSKHREGSAHFNNKAFDIRTRHLNFDEIITLSKRIDRFNHIKLVLFEWREKVNGKWIKHKAKYDNGDFEMIVEAYLDCDNPQRVSHLHIEW